MRSMPKVPSYAGYLNVFCFRDSVEIILQIHYGENNVLDENLNECGKELW